MSFRPGRSNPDWSRELVRVYFRVMLVVGVISAAALWILLVLGWLDFDLGRTGFWLRGISGISLGLTPLVCFPVTCLLYFLWPPDRPQDGPEEDGPGSSD